MAGLLERTVQAWASEPCDPFPCGREVWRYVCELAGVPMPDLPTHESRADMVALLREKGGLVEYARSLVEPLGFVATNDARKGDVGVVNFDGMGATCAIFLGHRWMAKGDHFILVSDAPALAAWRLECPKQ